MMKPLNFRGKAVLESSCCLALGFPVPVGADSGLAHGKAHCVECGHFPPTRGCQMPVFLSQSIVGPVTILELGEQLKQENVPEFRDTLQQLVEQGQIHLLLDCSRIQKIDSVGIGSLVGNWISLKKRGGKLGLLNPSARVREVLQIAGLQGVIEWFDDIGKALKSVAGTNSFL